MPRRPPRVHLDGISLHIVQRGHNREPCFMSNHVHLLLTPKKAATVPKLVISLGQRLQYINRQHRRTGTLWDSCYKSSLIQAATYLLTCMRYLEMNPVRAALVDDPAQLPLDPLSSQRPRIGVTAADPKVLYGEAGNDRLLGPMGRV